MTFPSNDAEIARVSAAWLALQATRDTEHEWSRAAWDSWLEAGNLSAMSRFVLQLCREVSPNDDKSIVMIGVAPLEDLIQTWEDEALALVEAEADNNPVLLEALRSVWTRTPTSRERIRALLATRNDAK